MNDYNDHHKEDYLSAVGWILNELYIQYFIAFEIIAKVYSPGNEPFLVICGVCIDVVADIDAVADIDTVGGIEVNCVTTIFPPIGGSWKSNPFLFSGVAGGQMTVASCLSISTTKIQPMFPH